MTRLIDSQSPREYLQMLGFTDRSISLTTQLWFSEEWENFHQLSAIASALHGI